MTLSRSCPPGPWLPSASGASGSRECHQLMSAPGVTAAGQTGEAGGAGFAGGTMSSSFSVTQRLNNQLSVDSSGSGGGHHAHHQHRQPLGSGLCDPQVMSRHPPHYSEATTAGATGQQLPHFPLHNNHSWNWSPPDANEVTSETHESLKLETLLTTCDDLLETRDDTCDHACDSLMLHQEDSESSNQNLPTKPYRTFYKSTPVWNWYSDIFWKQCGNRISRNSPSCLPPKYILLHE